MCPMAAALSSILGLPLPIRSLRMSNSDQDRQQFEKAAKVHHEVLRSDPVRFTTAPRPLGASSQAAAEPERPQRSRPTRGN